MEQKRVVIYVKHRSPYGWRAKRFFRRKGYAFEVSSAGEPPARLSRTNGRKVAPQVFVEGRPVGGFDVTGDLDRSGDLDRLVRGEV
jgi:glutaredoxin